MVRGIVEGFYGKPYSGQCRRVLIRYLSLLEEPVYLYAPKNDPFHRYRWRDDYPAGLWSAMEEDISYAFEKGVDFLFGISPWQFDDGEHGKLRRKARQALDSGAGGLAVLFDDIPGKVDAALAVRQLQFTEKALEGLDCVVLLCPSVYCIELLDRYGGAGYLQAWREIIPDRWRSLWTGDSVVSRDLDSPSLAAAFELLGEKPVIWDNLLADDYALRRIFLSGLAGRPPADHGYLLNPSDCLPAALHGALMLIRACGVECGWPDELGNEPEAWEILADFHHLPWTAGGDVPSLLEDIRRAFSLGASPGLLESLERVHEGLEKILDDLDNVLCGHQLRPYVTDLWKMVGWWKEILMLRSSGERLSRLRYLMLERLPYDHPLSMMSAGLAGIEGSEGL